MSTLNDPPKMQPATKATHVEPVIRGPKRAAIISGSLAGTSGAFMAGAGYLLSSPVGAPIIAAAPWLVPVLVGAGLLAFVGATVTASLAGIEAPKLPAMPTAAVSVRAQKEDKS